MTWRERWSLIGRLVAGLFLGRLVWTPRPRTRWYAIPYLGAERCPLGHLHPYWTRSCLPIVYRSPREAREQNGADIELVQWEAPADATLLVPIASLGQGGIIYQVEQASE